MENFKSHLNYTTSLSFLQGVFMYYDQLFKPNKLGAAQHKERLTASCFAPTDTEKSPGIFIPKMPRLISFIHRMSKRRFSYARRPESCTAFKCIWVCRSQAFRVFAEIERPSCLPLRPTRGRFILLKVEFIRYTMLIVETFFRAKNSTLRTRPILLPLFCA